MIEKIENEFYMHKDTLEKSLQLKEQICQCAQILNQCLENNGKILICGNGGSAADSQHFAAELSGRYKKERKKGFSRYSFKY